MSYTNFIGDLDIILRSVVSVVVLFLLSRAMGKKHIANLTFFDYVIGISIGSIAASFAVDESIPYVHGVIALVVYAVFALIVSKISLKGVRLRNILGGTPTILIQNGNLIEKNLKKEKFSINDLLEECRLNGVFNISDVDYAILETNGKVSFLLKAKSMGVTLGDMNIKGKDTGIQIELIIDGFIVYDHLKEINKNKSWLLNELKKRNINSPKNVLLASIDSVGNMIIQFKNDDINIINGLK
ncbi:DUF421 domain-containing protein [Clostridium cylindrosporum]|uniref:DUF421 domain-containing protein n=1 Tax=Clostridium cylindrosporum DSM 605 TaxID=1121307 RepID=A0A0J8G2V6_CLOCY|nr:DUF421 domain-containing protein [Clostridium cylindrosporum]KMT22031.1 hypothetical protein CLCY_3c03020 [Clostridium cylindrosporum DSM 605]